MNTWTIQLCPEGDGPPAEIRIRRLLKAALRQHGLRCVGISPGPGTPSPAAQERRSEPRPDSKPSEASNAPESPIAAITGNAATY